jgi:Flp pilus assembly protein TadG
MVVLAIGLVGLIALAGLVLDGGRAYGERRQMQNAADSASMAATRQLDRYITGATTDASLIKAAAEDTAEDNGADPAEVTCTLVRFDRTTIEPCPSGATMSQATKDIAAGVLVATKQTQETFFMGVVGQNDFTATADATAQIGRPGGNFVTPFVFCGTAPGHVPPVLIPGTGPTSVEGFIINDLAVGNPYSIYGNDIKNDGRDCGNGSSSFRGLANTGDTYPLPGDWDTVTGNHNGPTIRLVNSGNYCATTGDPDDIGVGCVLVLPLCPRSNGHGGTGFRIHCTDLGLFEVSHISNHDINAIFRGKATINQGGIVGPADPNGARIVALTE